MIRRLDGSFKGLRLIGSLRDTIRGVRRKASLPTDITELVKFSKVKEGTVEPLYNGHFGTSHFWVIFAVI